MTTSHTYQLSQPNKPRIYINQITSLTHQGIRDHLKSCLSVGLGCFCDTQQGKNREELYLDNLQHFILCVFQKNPKIIPNVVGLSRTNNNLWFPHLTTFLLLSLPSLLMFRDVLWCRIIAAINCDDNTKKIGHID